MGIESFLTELSAVTHHARMRRMVDVGRRSAAGDADASELIAALARHDNPYGRLLAAQAAHGSRDGGLVLAGLRDASRCVRARAAKIVAVVCDDAQAAEALALVLPGEPRSRLTARLAKRGRTAVVDAFLAAQLDGAARPDGKTVDLIPSGAASATERHAEALALASSPLTWQRMAVWQPEAETSALLAALAGSGPIDARLGWRLSTSVPVLAYGSPDAALRLVRRMIERGVELTDVKLSSPLAALAQSRPGETFDLLRAVDESAPGVPPPGAFRWVSFTRHTERLGGERIAYLTTRATSTLPEGQPGQRWFRRLSEADRERVLGAWLDRGYGSWGSFLLRRAAASGPLAAAREKAFARWSLAARTEDGAIALDRLVDLPADLRVREARRHLYELPGLATKAKQRLAYARFLPFAEAKQAVQTWLGHPEGEQRSWALRALVGTVRFEPASLGDVLALVQARKFEQDPVRLVMLQGLGELPLRVFAPAHLEGVGRCVQDALDAGDLSPATGAAAEKLIVRLFRKDAAWGAGWLAKLLEKRGSLSQSGLGEGLTPAEVRVLAPALAELASAWLTRERAGALIWLASSLGHRLGLVEPVVTALELLAAEQPFVHVAAAALGLLYAHVRPRFAELVPRLLAADRSFAIVACVARHVSRVRQDLLDPLLADQKMTGRFATGKTHWALRFDSGFERWTDRQQAAHARSLRAVIDDAARDVPAVLSTLETLIHLAFVDPAPVLGLAADPRPPVRERAIRWLARLDQGQGVPVLIEALGDDRARFAIYALRKALAEMSADEALRILRAAPLGKVTVAKEVVRLVGELPGDAAFQTLLALDRPDAHRDVRIAVLRALWDHLDRPEAWERFERAASDKDWVVASRLADIPLARLAPDVERRVTRLLARVLDRPEVEARVDLLHRVAYLPLRDEERGLFAVCLARMAGPHPDECRAATAAALVRMLPDDALALTERMRELAPNRRLLLVLQAEVAARLGPYMQAQTRPVALGLLAVLAADPRSVAQRIELAGLLFGPDDLTALLASLAERDELHVDAMVAALAVVRRSLEPERLERRLAAHADPRLRRLAVTALEAASGREHGWTDERRARLARYRADASPMVAGAAELVLPPE
jgi:hypothetical protein